MSKAGPLTADDTLNTQPRLRPFTLRFTQPELEREYQHYYAQSSVKLVRVGLVLALVLYLVFGTVDLAIAAEYQQPLWTIRTSVSAICLLGLAYTFLPSFTAHLQPVMVAVTASLAGGITLMLLITGTPVINTYYVGLILVCIATHTLLRLSFLNSLWLCSAIVLGYLAVEARLGANPGFQVFANAAFLCAAALIACMGNYAAAYQHRLAFYQRRIIHQAREESLYRSLHDALTGLANRQLLAERAERAFARDRRQASHVGLLFLDLNGFKSLNDQWGHHVGDQVLKAVANMLVRGVRETDTVARFGGDEFVILLEDLDSDIEAQVLAKRLIDLFDMSIQVPGGGEIKLTLSIGIAMHPEHGDDLQALLQCADTAMYTAKQQKGSSWQVYRPDNDRGGRPTSLKTVR